MVKRYLVTGGLGALGAPVVKALATQGHHVRVLDNLSRGSFDRLGDFTRSVETFEGDIRDSNAVNQAVRGVDSVLHLAAVNGTAHFYERPAQVLDVGVKGMLNVIDACLRTGVGELFVASSSEVYHNPLHVPTNETAPLVIPDPFNPRYSYSGSKIISELLAIHYGRNLFRRVVIFRPHNVYGPDLGWDHVIPQFVTRLKNLKETMLGSQEIPFPIQGSGEQTRSFLYIDDFVQGILLLLDRAVHSQIYHIGLTEEVTIRDLALRIAAILGIRIRIKSGPEVEGGTLRRCPDNAKIRTLGFTPRFNLDMGLIPTVQWYATHSPSQGDGGKQSPMEQIFLGVN